MSIEQVGVITGARRRFEQRRFEHIDGELRELIDALDYLKDAGQIDNVSVDINASSAAPFQAEQDTWNAGPQASVTIVIHHTVNGARQETRLRVHEVWWGDVNEHYSVAKQFRFWLWGLAIWAHPGKRRSALGSVDRVVPPDIPAQHTLWDRFRLFLVGVLFALLAFSIGTLTFLANRLLLWQAPDVLKVIANYVSASKAYTAKLALRPRAGVESR